MYTNMKRTMKKLYIFKHRRPASSPFIHLFRLCCILFCRPRLHNMHRRQVFLFLHKLDWALVNMTAPEYVVQHTPRNSHAKDERRPIHRGCVQDRQRYRREKRNNKNQRKVANRESGDGQAKSAQAKLGAWQRLACVFAVDEASDAHNV